jgi:hypothetical protein
MDIKNFRDILVLLLGKIVDYGMNDEPVESSCLSPPIFSRNIRMKKAARAFHACAVDDAHFSCPCQTSKTFQLRPWTALP